MVSVISTRKLLDELKHKVHSANFERLFAEKTAHLSGPQKLQLKMRLNELAKPCTTVIDLRRKVAGPVTPYVHQQRTHYLDNKAQQLFVEGLKANNGTYTQDTLRKITQYAREQQQQRLTQQLQADQQSKLGSFVLGRYYRRTEERMNFVSEVMITAQLGDKRVKFKAVTVDISLQGVQLKIPATVPAQKLMNQTVDIFYRGLAQDFVFDDSKPYHYQVLGTHKKDNQVYLRLRRDAIDDDDALDKLLRGLLNGYKFRYKVNVDHVIHSVRAKAHELQWLQGHQGVPVVFSGNPARTSYAIATQSNQDLIANCCQQQPRLLNALISQGWVRKKLKALCHLTDQKRVQLPFYFIKTTENDVPNYYAVPTAALTNNPPLKALLIDQQQGTKIFSMVLSVTYSHIDKLFVGLLNKMDVPDWHSEKRATANVSSNPELAKYKLSLAEVEVSKIVNDHPRLLQLYTKNGLCNALFVHQQESQRRINFAALMPFKKGLPSWFQSPELWLSQSHNILGGAKIEQQIISKLKQIEPTDSFENKTLLLRLSQSDAEQTPTVNGRWLSDFTSFDEASLYMKKLYKENKLLAVNIELYRCNKFAQGVFKDDMQYINSYLPHRAREVERQLKSLDAVIGVQDITLPILSMALA